MKNPKTFNYRTNLDATKQDYAKLEKAYIHCQGAINTKSLIARLTDFAVACRTFATIAVITTPDIDDAKADMEEYLYLANMADQMLAQLQPKTSKPWHVYPDYFVA